MRQRLDQLLRDATLVTFALAIALGVSLYTIAEQLGDLIVGAIRTAPNDPYETGLSFRLGHHVFDFNSLVSGLIGFVAVLVVVLVVHRRSRPNSDSN